MQCQCLKTDGKPCTRDGSKKSGDNPLFCWQHQNCKSKITTPTQRVQPPARRVQPQARRVQPQARVQVSSRRAQSSTGVQLSTSKVEPPQPIEINLYLSPTALLLDKSAMSGGDPMDLIRMTENNKNKYLVSKDNSYSFMFNAKNNIKKISGTESQYLGAGALTAVFALTKIYSPDDSIPMDNLILRMVDLREDLDEYLVKYEEDSQILPENLPKIYLYGNIYKEGQAQSRYMIVKKYNDESVIQKLDANSKILLASKLLRVLKKLQQCGYLYRDLKLSNIGYDTNDKGDVATFIVLDHDEKTILRPDSSFFDEFVGAYCNWYCAGTYPPYYLIDDAIKGKKDWKQRLDKLAVGGLAHTLIELFYGREGSRDIYGKFVYPFYQTGDTGDIYNGFKKLYTKPQFDQMMAAIDSLDPVGSIIKVDDAFLKNQIIKPVLRGAYNEIPTFDQLSTIFDKHFNFDLEATPIVCPSRKLK